MAGVRRYARTLRGQARVAHSAVATAEAAAELSSIFGTRKR